MMRPTMHCYEFSPQAQFVGNFLTAIFIKLEHYLSLHCFLCCSCGLPTRLSSFLWELAYDYGALYCLIALPVQDRYHPIPANFALALPLQLYFMLKCFLLEQFLWLFCHPTRRESVQVFLNVVLAQLYPAYCLVVFSLHSWLFSCISRVFYFYKI